MMLFACALLLWTATPGEIGEPPAAAESLMQQLRGFATARSMILGVSMTVQDGRFGRHTRFSLWTVGRDQALLRIEEPQQKAGHALLRVGPQVYLFEPETGHVSRLGAAGARGLWARPYFELVDILAADPFDGPFRAVEVTSATLQSVPVTRLSLVFESPVARCDELHVDFPADGGDPLEARCVGAEKDVVRLVFREFRDVGSVRVPVEVELFWSRRPWFSLTVRFLRVWRDVPIGPERFSLSTLRAHD
jgi:hypothetical protein